MIGSQDIVANVYNRHLFLYGGIGHPEWPVDR